MPYSSNLFFGLKERSIESVEQSGDVLSIYGNGFSSESRVYIDGQATSTTFVSSQLLQVIAPTQSYNSIEIKQHSGLDKAIGQGLQLEVSDLNDIDSTQ